MNRELADPDVVATALIRTTSPAASAFAAIVTVCRSVSAVAAPVPTAVVLRCWLPGFCVDHVGPAPHSADMTVLEVYFRSPDHALETAEVMRQSAHAVMSGRAAW